MSPDADRNVQIVANVVRFDAAVFSITAIKKACYRLLPTVSVEITQDDGFWVCNLSFPEGTDAEKCETVKNALKNEVLDQDLRETIGRETEAVRNAVLALAFSRSGLQG